MALRHSFSPLLACRNAFKISAAYRFQSTAPQPAASSREERMDKEAKASESFVMNLFLGRPVTSQIFPYPDILSKEEKETISMILGPTEKFFQEVNDAEKNDLNECLNPETLEAMRELGAFGMQVPAEHGGVGLNNTQYARIAEIIGASDLGLSITMGAHQSIGFKGILIVGTNEQKEKYLKDLASGKKIAAFALTEPTSGSDAGSIRSRAVPTEDGKHYILNGSKLWISNGGLAEIYTVFAQTPVPNKEGGMSDKVTAFIVERSFGGVTNGPPEKKMGIKASNTSEVFFENVKIPAENVLGGVGKGFKVAMEILNNGRFGMCAALAGTMKYSLNKAIDFATNRVQFGRKIHTYGVIQEKIARMVINQYIAESLGLMIASNMDSGSKDYHLEAAISKIFSSEAAWATTDEAIQVLGGMGFMREAGLERVLRDIRVFRIFEGTNDILRLFVALTGLQYAGGHLKELQNALKNPASNFGLILGEGTKRAKRAIGFSQSNLIDGIHPELSSSGALLSKSIELFGASCELLLTKYGKRIIEEQFILHRLANSAIDIYTSAVVLSRASKALTLNVPAAQHELKIARIWTNEAFERTQQNLLQTKSENSLKNFNDLSSICHDVCENGTVVASRPIGV